MSGPASLANPGRAQDALGRLFDDFSLEMTAKDVGALEAAAALVPAGTLVSVTFLPGENLDARVEAAACVQRLGLQPVPHISARRLASEAELESFLDTLAQRVALRRVFVIAGDLEKSAGPYDDALAVIRSGLLERYGVEHVGIAGYPEGHPAIDAGRLWQALEDKQQELADRGLASSIMTQFGFDADPILAWLAELRARGIGVPVRIGVAGPASIKTLLRFAARCGVGASAKVMQKYGLSITRLLGSAGPDPILAELSAGLDMNVHGDTMLHFYPFGGFDKTAEWIRDYRRKHGL